MHKTEFIQKRETHKILLDFDIEADYQILSRWAELVLINKKKRIFDKKKDK